MLNPTFTKPFRKELKLAEKRGKDVRKLREVTTMLINEQPLLPRHENHPLHGGFEGKWECHVEPDWLLIYRIVKEERRITFYRTGSHADLF
jgi:mRNA interferase YafQ